uniref:Uncharacterized protein n=1 Tax=Palisada sp. TaxID=1955416 RepID=A0A1Z1MSK9_9FLOR|nr:hypothetical protein [Palisada sp.]
MVHNNFYVGQYLYSPISRYHKIQTYLKVKYIFSILLITPYIDSNHTINYILILSLVIETNILKKLLYSFQLSNIKFIIFFIAYTIMINKLTVYGGINYHQIELSKLLLPSFCQVPKIYLNRCKIFIKYNIFIILVPKYILKVTCLLAMLNSIMKTLYLCTKYEVILETAIINLNNIQKIIKLNYREYIMNLFLAYLFLQELTLNSSNTILSLKIKKINLRNKHCLSIILIKYLKIFLSNSNNNSIMLWNRNIKYKNFDYFKIYRKN